MKEEEGFILYFDILGYKNIVNSATPEIDERLRYILDLYSERQGRLNFDFVFNEKYINNKEKLMMRCFSDNFLFLYENRNYEECDTEKKRINYFLTLNNMICVASMIQRQFIEKGILTRGSISFGKINYNSKIIYGKSLIKAVELEEGHEEPSIVVDNYFKSIEDKQLYLYEKMVSPFDCHKNSSLDHYEIVCGIKKYLSTLDLSNCSDEDKNHILKKIKWLIDKMNEHFAYNGVKKYTISNDYKLIELKN